MIENPKEFRKLTDLWNNKTPKNKKSDPEKETNKPQKNLRKRSFEDLKKSQPKIEEKPKNEKPTPQETEKTSPSPEARVQMFANFEEMKKTMLEESRQRAKEISQSRHQKQTGKNSLAKKARVNQPSESDMISDGDTTGLDSKEKNQGRGNSKNRRSCSKRSKRRARADDKKIDLPKSNANRNSNTNKKRKRKRKDSERGTGNKKHKSKTQNSGSSLERGKLSSKKAKNSKKTTRKKNDPNEKFNEPIGSINNISYTPNHNPELNPRNNRHYIENPANSMTLGLANHHEAKLISLTRELAIQKESASKFQKKAQAILRQQLIKNEEHERIQQKRYLLTEKERLGDYVLQRDMTKTKEVWVDGVAMATVKNKLESVRRMKEKRAEFKKALKKKKGAMITAEEIVSGEIQPKKDSKNLIIIILEYILYFCFIKSICELK